MKIKNPITVSLILLIAALSAITHWSSVWITDDLLQETMDKREADKASAVSKLLENLLLSESKQVQLATRLTANRNRLGRSMTQMDDEAMAVIRETLDHALADGGVNFMEVTDRHEAVLYRVPAIEDGAKPVQNWGVFEALSGQGMLSSAIESGQLTLRASEPIYANGRIIGTLSAGISLSNELLTQISKGLASGTLLLSSSGVVLAASEGADTHIDRQALTDAFAQKIPIYHLDNQLHRTRVYFPITVIDNAYVLVVDIDSTLADKQLAQANQRATLTSLALTVFNIVIAMLLLRWIMRPLFRLRERAKAMALELTGSEIRSVSSSEIGEVVGMLDTLTTRLASQNEQLRHAAEDAEIANRSKSTFIANMSHELRTPMNAIIGLTHMLSRNNNDPGQREKLGKISRAADHLLRLLNDVLDLSKMDAERMVLAQDQFTIGAVMRNLESICSSKAESKGLKLAFAIRSTLLQQPLIGDALRLQQVLVNLAGNAIKFTEQGSVTLLARIEDENDAQARVHFAVLDTGIGIPEAAQQRIFAAFEQADGSTTRQYGGSGLGLTISQRFIGLMGGEIQVSSRAEGGSSFAFTITLAKAANATAEEHSAAASGAQAEQELRTHYAGTRILVAEDDWVNQEVIRELIVEVLGFSMDLAEDGERALAMAEKDNYALILMDMQMPEMDGVEATQCIRQLPGCVLLPIIAMTANAFAEDRAACMDAGMNDFLTKPVNPDLLFVTLLKWLNKPATG